ncbi:gliding motility protein GldC [Fulvitalea axinellae]|uniref:Gliding motility protein GldC n=1 Tax=Fulvitalea axinellae TaxID=1182444 RepID=A0AAU9DAE9_9BACT|nr:gliding motility protein GldC [Fulvitalea axinellae]
MNRKEIKINVDLDNNNIPEKLSWEADDSTSAGPKPIKAVSVNLWDGENGGQTLRIDLWDKELNTHEMKRFFIDSLGGWSQTLLNSTGDEFMANEINKLCDKLSEHHMKELKKDQGK